MNTKKQRLIFTILYLAYTSIYIARINLSMAGPELINLNLIDTVQLGALGSVFSTLYSFGRLINGGISDRTPPYIMLTTGLAVAGISNLLIGFFPPFIGIFILWTANAYAQSMLWSSVLCVVSSIYEKEVAKKKTSLMVTSVATGNILAIIVSTFLIQKLGVAYAFIIPGLITLILGALVLLSTKKVTPPPVEDKKHLSMVSLLKNKEIRLMLVPALFHGVMKENISLWMAVYVVDTFFVDLSKSSYYILLIPVIGLIGRTVYPLFYKLCKNSGNSVSLVGFLFCVIASVALFFNSIGMVASVLALSVIYASVSVINTTILSIYPMHFIKTGNVASVSGVMDFATYLGGGIASAIYGVVIKNFGYFPMFASWVVISLISILFILKIKKSRKAN